MHEKLSEDFLCQVFNRQKKDFSFPELIFEGYSDDGNSEGINSMAMAFILKEFSFLFSCNFN